jgi:aminoglycoside 3-N-acetyltransferase
MQLVSAIKKVAPQVTRQPFILQSYRSARKVLRAARRRVSRPVRRAELARDFRRLGLSEGDTVFAHSSLRRLGPVEEGAKTVIEALLDVLGPSGTLAMPAFSMVRGCMELLASQPLFDPAMSPSMVGKITDIFRNWPGVLRSVHPTHSVCAIGPNASALLKDHYLSPTPFGPATPFCRLHDYDAIVIGIGIRVSNFTMFHVHEDLDQDFPLPIYYENPIESKVLIDGIERRVTTKVHDEALAPYRCDNDPEASSAVWDWLFKHGYIREGKTGGGKTCIIRARTMLHGQEQMLKEGLTIYNTPRMFREGWRISDRLVKSYP